MDGTGTTRGPIDRWLATGEAGAAGRLGLFRIGYALFYLWHLTFYDPRALSGVPTQHDNRMLLNGWMPLDLAAEWFVGMQLVLVAALVFLGLGYRTRSATLVVAVVGALFESLYVDLDFEHSTPFLTAFLPASMLLFGDWGATWSLDSARRTRRGIPRIDPEDTSPRFVLPIRFNLVILCALFCSAGLSKLAAISTWFSQDAVFGPLLVDRYLKAVLLDRPLNPLAFLCVDYPAVDTFLRWFVALFELCFPLALLHRTLRHWFLSMGLLFHAVNAIWLGVTFTPILIVYLLFVDWQGLHRRCFARTDSPQGTGISERSAATLAVTLAALTTAGWGLSDLVHRSLTLGGLLDTYAPWYPVLPVAVIGSAVATTALPGAILGLIRPTRCG